MCIHMADRLTHAREDVVGSKLLHFVQNPNGTYHAMMSRVVTKTRNADMQ